MTLDDIRRHYPLLGLALYALEPGQHVTLEIHSAQGQVFSFRGAGEAEVLAKAFPELTTGVAEQPQSEKSPSDNIFD